MFFDFYDFENSIISLVKEEEKEMSNLSGVKIYKNATTKSIMDITSALDYYKEKKDGELEYAGSLVFAITELSTPRKYEKAFVRKKAAKVLLYSIINQSFSETFKNGFKEYGGSSQNGVIRSRIFSVRLDQKNRFIFQIDEGIGKFGDNKSIEMETKERTVQSYVSYENAQQLAHECYDYIKASELLAQINGKPLYTLTPESKKALERNSGMAYDKATPEVPDSYEHSEKVENVEIEAERADSSSYVIRIGTMAGTPISSLDTSVLEMLIQKIVPDTIDKSELVEESRKELAKRYT